MKMCYRYTMEYYLAAKKNEIINILGKWIEVEKIVLCVVTQT